MAEENESQESKEGEEEQSMDEILGSIREILSDEDQENQSETGASASNTEEGQVNEGDAEHSPEPDESPSENAATVEPETTTDNTFQDDEVVPESDLAIEDQIEGDKADDVTLDATENEPSGGDGDNSVSDDGSDIVTDSEAEEPNEVLELTKDMIAPAPPDFDAGSPIVSGATQTASADPLQELAKALLNRRDIAIGNRDMTLEGLIREILRPLLKEWLDDNLPYLIERLVKKEIDHMVNKAERLDL